MALVPSEPQYWGERVRVPRRKRGSILRIALTILSLAVLAMIGIGLQGSSNPKVPQGGSNTFPSTGTEGAANGEAWDVVSASGTVVAKASAPIGWTVSISSSTFTVGAPASATIATNYKVRYGQGSDGGTGSTGATLDAVSPRRGVRPSTFSRPARSQPQDAYGRRLDEPVRSVSSGPVVGGQAFSAPFDVIAPPPPPAGPTNLTAEQRVSYTPRVDLNWTDNADGETGYKVEYRPEYGGTWSQIGVTKPNATHYTHLQGVYLGSASYRVRATSAASGDSAYSNIATTTTAASYNFTVSNDVERNFVVALPSSGRDPSDPDYVAGHNYLQLTNDSFGGSETVQFADGTATSYHVPAMSTQTILLPDSMRLLAKDGVESKAIRISGPYKIAVRVIQQQETASESFVALPGTSLGFSYMISSYPGAQIAGVRPRFAIAAAADATSVTITPSVTLNANRPAGVPYSITLNGGQTYQVEVSNGSDPTGTTIVADKAVAVYGGHQGTNVVSNKASANPLTEQLRPSDQWGKRFFLTPFKDRNADTVLRVTANRNNTDVFVAGVKKARLKIGETYEQLVPGAAEITASKPVQAVQYCQGEGAQNTYLVDPSMLLLTRVDAGVTTNRFNVPDVFGFSATQHFLNVVVPTASVDKVVLDDVALPASGFQAIGTSGYSYAQIPVAPGDHFLTNRRDADGTIIGCLYGFSTADMYANPLPSSPSAANPAPSAPAAPSSLTAQPASGYEVDLQWSDNSSNEDSFRLERRQGTSTTWTVVEDNIPANTTSYPDKNRSPRTTYTYRIRSSGDLDSDWSNEASATTPDVKPLPPTDLTASATSSTAIHLHWNDASDNETEFRLERKLGANGTFELAAHIPAGQTSYDDTQLTKKTLYIYRMRTENAVGDSDWTDDAPATTRDSKPAAPSGLTASSMVWNNVDLAWTDNANNETGYQVERMQPGTSGWTPIKSLGAGATSCSDQSVRGATNYLYRVKATNPDADEDSEYSNVAPVTTPYPPVPSAPFNLTASVQSVSTIRLTWSDSSISATSFAIERKGGGAGWSEVGSTPGYALSYVDQGLTAATTYTYRVRARNVSGTSTDASNEDSATTYPPADEVVYIVAVPSGATSMRVYWGTVDSTSSYRVYRTTGSTSLDNATLVATVPAGAAESVLHYDDPNLTTGQYYNYAVVPVSGGTSGSLDNPNGATLHFAGHIPNPDALPVNAPPATLGQAIINKFFPGGVPNGSQFFMPDGDVFTFGGGYGDGTAFGHWNREHGTMLLDQVLFATHSDKKATGSGAALCEGPYYKLYGQLPHAYGVSKVTNTATYSVPAIGSYSYSYYGEGEGVNFYNGVGDTGRDCDVGFQYNQAGPYKGQGNYPARWSFFARFGFDNPDQSDDDRYVRKLIGGAFGRANQNYFEPGSLGATITTKSSMHFSSGTALFAGAAYTSLGLVTVPIYARVGAWSTGGDPNELEWIPIGQKVVGHDVSAKCTMSLVQPNDSPFGFGIPLSPAPPLGNWPHRYRRSGIYIRGAYFLGGNVDYDGTVIDWNDMRSFIQGQGGIFHEYTNTCTTVHNTAVNGEPAKSVDIATN